MALRPQLLACCAALLAAAACADAPSSLLELPVASAQAVAPERYREAAALAAGGGSPVEIALRVAGAFEGATQQLLQVNEGAEAPSAARVTVLRDGLLDDSLRGERWDVSLERTPQGAWSIREVQRAWRCRRGGSTEGFAAAPCP